MVLWETVIEIMGYAELLVMMIIMMMIIIIIIIKPAY
jgi:hypothetical protein